MAQQAGSVNSGRPSTFAMREVQSGVIVTVLDRRADQPTKHAGRAQLFVEGREAESPNSKTFNPLPPIPVLLGDDAGAV